MRTLLRLLGPLVIGALFLFLVFALSGCTPSYLSAALVHQSHAMHGPGPWPVGGPGDESTLNGIEGGVGWERGRAFAEANLLYALRERNTEGGPWVGTFKLGFRFAIHRYLPDDPFPTVEPMQPPDPDPWAGMNPRPKHGQ